MNRHLSSSNHPVKDSSRFLTIAGLLVVPLILLGCPGNNKPAVGTSASPSASASASASATKSDFDGERAFEHVRKQVEFGPRPPGSAELERTRSYMIDQLKSYGLKTTTDEFHPVTPVGERKMVNVTAELSGDSNDVIIISSHYDTKLFKEFKFVGANDGGSSTGALLEIARVIAANKQKPKFTYWFVFFDGEEAICKEWEDCHNPNPADPDNPLPDNTYGSRRYVSQLIDKKDLKRVRAMILLDIIGYRDLLLRRDDMSTSWLVESVWQTARELGYSPPFVNQREGIGGDDHEPFLRAGIDAVDIIQLATYPYWHTKDDTLDKVSARSLKIVGDAVIISLPKIEDRLQSRSR